MKMMQKSTKISEYIWKQKEETYTIGWDDTSEKPISSDKAQSLNLKGRNYLRRKRWHQAMTKKGRIVTVL
jgi:hypothetical protein